MNLSKSSRNPRISSSMEDLGMIMDHEYWLKVIHLSIIIMSTIITIAKEITIVMIIMIITSNLAGSATVRSSLSSSSDMPDLRNDTLIH